jgi:hypothetical protein
MLHIFWNDGSGDLSNIWSRRIAGVSRLSASAGDLDGDGAADLLLAASTFQSPNDGLGQVGTLYGARRLQQAGVRHSTAAPREVVPIVGGRLQVLAVTPNPARGAFEVRWSAAQGTSVTLELIDLAGRRVRSIETTAAAQGHTRFDRLDALSPGVYWIRLRQGATARSRRIALVR